MYEMTGTVKTVMEPQTFGSGFTKREFVVTSEEDKYPQEICFEAVQDKLALVDNIAEGDKVTVSFDLRGREWQGRYFVNLRAWRIIKSDGSNAGGSAPANEDGPPIGDFEPAADSDDDLPF